MTDFDKRLIENARQMRPTQYFKVSWYINIADTEEARDILFDILHELKLALKK